MKCVIFIFFIACTFNLEAQPVTFGAKTHVSGLSIFARDAAKYIGKHAKVYGIHYKIEIQTINAHCVYILSYMGSADKPKENFIDIVEVDTRNEIQAQWVKTVQENIQNPAIWAEIAAQKHDEDYYDCEAEGKIILFKGKPAIVTKYDKMIFLTHPI